MNNLVGQVLADRYRVDAFLGRGGMAEVYKVWDSHRTTDLAMKLLRKDLAQDPIFLRRFRREAQTLEKLKHPNIVRFYGLGQDDLLAYILMDYVEGTSLRTEIFRSQGKGISPQRVLEIMRPVCSALNYAHKMGMVHCDIKPGNIMIDNSGKVLVTDFGVARHADAATATMVGMGTPAYMAPEQVLGKDPTRQTDIYALGVLMFEMLTGGERPFTGERAETTGTTGEKVRWEQIHLEPPSPRKFNPQIRVSLERIVLKCLEKNPGDRYPNVIELLNVLQRAIPVDEGAIKGTEAIPPTAQDFPPGQIPPEPPVGSVSGAPSKWIRNIGIIFGVFIILLVGSFIIFNMINTPEEGYDVTPIVTETNIDDIHTQAAQTMAANLTGTALNEDTLTPTFTVTPVTPTSTLMPTPTITVTPTSPTITSTPTHTVTPITPTFTSTPTPTPTAIMTPTIIEANPQINNVRFCDRPCLEPGAIQLGTFPERTIEVFMALDYSGMRPGMFYTRVWTFGNIEWVRYECIWRGPESGTFEVRLWDVDGLRSGVWTVTIAIEGQVEMREAVSINGTYDFWDPAGVRTCEDW